VKYLPNLLGERRHSPARQWMADETARRYLFVAIDRAIRWVFIRIYNSKTAANTRRFLRGLE
jgi:transposase-like protein